jgi:hypothetical protein
VCKKAKQQQNFLGQENFTKFLKCNFISIYNECSLQYLIISLLFYFSSPWFSYTVQAITSSIYSNYEYYLLKGTFLQKHYYFKFMRAIYIGLPRLYIKKKKIYCMIIFNFLFAQNGQENIWSKNFRVQCSCTVLIDIITTIVDYTIREDKITAICLASTYFCEQLSAQKLH